LHWRCNPAATRIAKKEGELVENEPFDLWVGDEAWDIDYFLHENPELKRAPYTWMTDFVGWLPMPDGGAPEQTLTADYNAEMIEQIARFPALRDRAVFVGNPGDVVPHDASTGTARAGAWTTARPGRRSWPRPSRTTSAARSATALSRPTVPPAPPPSWLNSSELCPSELCLSELYLSELYLSELYLSELYLSELCLSELCLSELGLSQQAPALPGVAQHVRQPMLRGEPRSPV
jgi:hypothetical protein